jgi:DNA-binding protein H-NS
MTTTTSYADLKRQIQDLQEQAEKARAAEIVDAKSKIKEIMQTYNLTVLDIGGTPKVAKARKTVAAKYRDSATGETWTGRGRAPKWLEGKTKEDYLIK